jgi:hypothetical protein
MTGDNSQTFKWIIHIQNATSIIPIKYEKMLITQAILLRITDAEEIEM